MHRITSFIFLLASCLLLPLTANASIFKRERPPRQLPTQIEAMRGQQNYLLNTAKFDADAWVYYVYQIDLPAGTSTFSRYQFNKNTEFLAPAHNAIQGKGAELIMHLHYDKETAARYARYKRSGNNSHLVDIPALARECSLKCPIVNTDSHTARRALFSYNQGNHINERFCALDAHGNVLAYFSRINNSIIMYNLPLKSRKTLKSSGFKPDEWEATAIMESYEELVKLAQRRELAGRHKNKTASHTASRSEAKKSTKPAKTAGKKPQKPASPKRPTRLDDEDEEEDDDDFLDEEDEEEEEEEDTDEDEEEDEDEFLDEEDE